jgi:hypothetical protein
VGQHAADGLEQNTRGRTVMERTRLFGVYNVSLVQEVVVAELSIKKIKWLK